MPLVEPLDQLLCFADVEKLVLRIDQCVDDVLCSEFGLIVVAGSPILLVDAEFILATQFIVDPLEDGRVRQALEQFRKGLPF